MTRVTPLAIPIAVPDVPTEHAAPSTGGPFRAALRAAGKADKSSALPADGDAPSATAQAAPLTSRALTPATAVIRAIGTATEIASTAAVADPHPDASDPANHAVPGAPAAANHVSSQVPRRASHGVAPSFSHGLAPATPSSLAPATPSSLAPVTPSSLAPATPSSIAPATPSSLAPATPGSIAPSAANRTAPGTRTAGSPRAPASAAAGDTVDPVFASTLAAAYGTAGLASSTQLPLAGAAHDDSPVAAWVAAAVGRAVGSFADTTGSAAGAASPDATATATIPAVPAAATLPSGLAAVLTMTPLEQAVHELIGQITARDAHGRGSKPAAASASDDLVALSASTAPHTLADPTRGVAPAGEPARAAALTQPAELPWNPSHVHLVLDDGPDRVVATVAVRGSDIHVALRASDDATAAALARNAGSLDHAMRARGLALGELTAEREPREHQQSTDHPLREHQQPNDHPPRERQNPDAEPFELEE